MKLSQNPEELTMMMDFVYEQGFSSFLEIGSRYGTTLVEIAEMMPKDSRIVSVEMPNGPWGRADSLPQLQGRIQMLNDDGYDTHLILGNSTDVDIIEKVKALGPFDFVFIDGDHSTAGATADWENYGPMGKCVGFHDVNTDLDIATVWREKIRKEVFVEFISANEPKMGIGIRIQDTTCA